MSEVSAILAGVVLADVKSGSSSDPVSITLIVPQPTHRVMDSKRNS